jgi:hypothetical protein
MIRIRNQKPTSDQYYFASIVLCRLRLHPVYGVVVLGFRAISANHQPVVVHPLSTV